MAGRLWAYGRNAAISYLSSLAAGLTLMALTWRWRRIGLALLVGGFALLFGVVYSRFWRRETVYRCCSKPMRRRGGELVADVGALSKWVWHVRGAAAQGRQCIYGPYRRLRPGTYIVDFRVKIRQLPGGEVGGVYFDIARCRGGSQAHPLDATPTKQPGEPNPQYRDASIRFAVSEDMAEDRFEWRVFADDPGVEVYVDTITLTEI